jgi:hypothetical protein
MKWCNRKRKKVGRKERRKERGRVDSHHITGHETILFNSFFQNPLAVNCKRKKERKKNRLECTKTKKYKRKKERKKECL